jgi:hypothetical protein
VYCCFRFEIHFARRAFSRAILSAGSSIAISTAIIDTTTSSSTSVKAVCDLLLLHLILLLHGVHPWNVVVLPGPDEEELASVGGDVLLISVAHEVAVPTEKARSMRA